MKKENNVKSKYVVDTLVEQTVSSLGSASFVYNTDQNTIEHRFMRTARTLDENENAYFSRPKDGKLEPYTSVKLEAIPYGLMFQAVCVEGNWVLSSPNNCYLNDMKFQGKCTVFEKFEELLKASGFSLNSLSIDTVYTFVLGSNEFSLIPLKRDYLILRSVYTMVKQEKPDPLNKLRDERLRPYLVNLKDKSFGLVNRIIRRRRKQLFNQHIDSDLPISYFVLTHEKVYQFSTPLFDTLWSYYVYATKL